MVGRPDQRAALGQHALQPLELVERVDLPRQVVQADGAAPGAARAGARADLEHAEVVVVGRAGRLEERALARHVDQRLEPEHLLVELAGDLDVADVEHGVVEAGDGHGRLLTVVYRLQHTCVVKHSRLGRAPARGGVLQP